MPQRRDRHLAWRAIIGVIALYAVLLQPFLAAAAPGAGAALAGYLCASDADGAPSHDGAPAHDGTAAHAHSCCTAAQLAGPFLPPVAAVTVVAWPERRRVAVVWRPEAECPRTGPPRHAHAPRGPPSA